MGAKLALALALALSAQQGGSTPKKPTRLFSGDEPIHIAIRAPIAAIVATPADLRTTRPGTLGLVAASSEDLPILLSPRGFARRNKEACKFPPLKVEFTSKPAKTSLFERQHRLKLTTHCRIAPAHQNNVLLEYAAYRLFNVLSPLGLRVRIANVDYVEADGRPFISRTGFFVEDVDDAAKRNGLVEVQTAARILPSQLDPATAARASIFEYMIGNLDWSMRAAHAGLDCCHNFKLMAAAPDARTSLIPVPYDFDYSGLVNAPYAIPPDGIPVATVRERRYRGYCIHNSAALGAAGEFRSKRGELLAALAAVPQLDEGKRQNAAAYLEAFFRDIGSDADVTKRLLKTCIN
jgi:hypothetical protein